MSSSQKAPSASFPGRQHPVSNDFPRPPPDALAEDMGRQLYNFHSVQRILNLLLSEEIEYLDPVFDIEHVARYPSVERVTGQQPAEVIGILDRMAIHGLLDARVVERVMACDRCGGVNIRIKPVCAFCDSTTIRLLRTMEHVSCGYVDLEDAFSSKGGLLVCPRCGSEARTGGPDIRASEGWFVCSECQKRMRDPRVDYVCRHCSRSMTVKDMGFVDLYSFSIGDNVDLNAVLRIELVNEAMVKLGYQTESPGTITGKSGKRHGFDLVGEKKGLRVAMNVVYSNVIVNEDPIVSLFGAKFDTGVDHCALIAVPGTSDAAKSLASSYGVDVLEGKEIEPILENVKTLVLAWEKNR